MEPLSDIHQLHLQWPIPDYSEYYKSRVRVIIDCYSIPFSTTIIECFVRESSNNRG